MSIASVGLTDRQRRALAVMGIDVWVRRDAPLKSLPSPRRRRLQRHLLQQSRRSLRLKRVQSLSCNRRSAANRRRRARLTSRSISIALQPQVSLRWASARVRSISSWRRDIVLAVAGAAAELQKSQFRWPQTQTGDASESAARNAYRGFLRGQVERASGAGCCCSARQHSDCWNPTSNSARKCCDYPTCARCAPTPTERDSCGSAYLTASAPDVPADGAGRSRSRDRERDAQLRVSVDARRVQRLSEVASRMLGGGARTTSSDTEYCPSAPTRRIC